MTMMTQKQITTWEQRAFTRLRLLALPGVVVLLFSEQTPWVFMCLLAISVYLTLKLLTFVDCREARNASPMRSMGYLLLWPGMDAGAFFASTKEVDLPRKSEWALALIETTLGVLTVTVFAPLVFVYDPYLAGMIGFAGIVLLLHFGLFHVLSLLWRRAGVDARPIMNAPLLASSLGEFWGRRWNVAFRDVTHAYVFRPLVRRIGATGATMAAFLASGLVHDLVISLPARGGWGLPTLYFLGQGCGVLFERSRLGKWIGLGRGIAGRLYCGVVTVAAIPLLFHEPFIGRIIDPMLTVITSL